MKCFSRIVLVVLLLLSHGISAQFSVSGIIHNSFAEPLEDVNIQVEHKSIGAYTDSLGRFQLLLEQAAVLSVSHSAYQSVLIRVSRDTTLNIKLERAVIQLQEIEIIPSSTVAVNFPASYAKIARNHLERDNGTTIAPALNRVTGLYMHSGALNTNRITIRGVGNRSPFSTTKIRAYLDDIPLTTGDGETTIEDVDLSLLQDVEVWKGPTASLYGAGLGGMIHLKTKNKEELTSSSVSSGLTVGSYGLIRNVSTADYTNSKKTLNLGVNYNNTHQDGYRDNNQYDRETISLLAKYYAKKGSETTFFGNLTSLKAFIPSSLNQQDYDNEPQKAAFNWKAVRGFEDYDKTILGVSHQFKLADFKRYRLENKTSTFFTSRDAYESRPFNILEEQSSSVGFRSTFTMNQKEKAKKNLPSLSMGVEAYLEDYDWKTLETNKGIAGKVLSDNVEQRRYFNVFAQTYFEFSNKATLFAGVNLNSTSYEYKDLFNGDNIDLSGDYAFSSILSPNVGFSYQFRRELALFASVSHGFSPPSLQETLNPDGTINPEIEAEKGWNYELGARGYLLNRIAYELTVYTMQINDLLVARRITEDQFIGLNAGKTNHSGFEGYITTELVKAKNWTLSSFISYTYSNYTFSEFIDEGNDYSGNELTGTPPHVLNMGIDVISKIGFYGNLMYRLVDAFPMRDDNSIYSQAYQVYSLKTGFKRKIVKKLELDASVGIDNLFNERYASMILINAGSFGNNLPRYYYPGLPRNYFTSISLKYIF